MQTDDFQKFHDGIIGVMGFYGRSVSSFALDVWWMALKEHDLAAIVDAFNRHLTNPDAGQFPPKPADIIRMLQGSTQDSALRAWAKVDQAVRRIGTYCDVVFDDAPETVRLPAAVSLSPIVKSMAPVEVFCGVLRSAISLIIGESLIGLTTRLTVTMLPSAVPSLIL